MRLSQTLGVKVSDIIIELENKIEEQKQEIQEEDR